jgi:hypothetical protein
MDWARRSHGAKKKCIQNLRGENFCKAASWNTEEEMKG